MKISEAFDAYKREYMIPKRFSKRVVEYHDYIKRKLIDVVGDKKINKLTLDDILDWMGQMKYLMDAEGEKSERAPNTIRCDMQRIRGVLKYMYLKGEKCLNYQAIPVPKNYCVERCFLYEEEVQAMIDNAYNIRNKFVISLLYSSGIRLSELLSLNRGDIVNKTFSVIGKGNKMRICFIDERTEELMDDYLKTRSDDNPALIVSLLYKDRMSASNVQLLIRNSAKRAKIEKTVTPHILRHSFATNFLRNNGNIRYLSNLLGHANVATTMIYSHVVDNDLKNQYDQFHSF